MIHVPIMFVLGGTVGTAVGLYLVSGHVSGLDAVLGIAAPAFAGSGTGSPLGFFTGISGGIIGGLVGAAFVSLPFDWIWTHSVFPALTAKVIVAGALAAALSLHFPH